MPSVKRKVPPASLLQRRVRPRYEPEPDSDIEDDLSDEPSEEDARSSGSNDDEDEPSGDDDDGEHSKSESGSQSGSEDEGEEEEEDDEEGDDSPKVDASQLSFGALARAQAVLGGPSRRKHGDDSRDKDGSKAGHAAKAGSTPSPSPRKPEKRSSKHAPVEMSSKKPVSRKRDFLTVTAELKKPQPRDPRFMPLGPGSGASAAAAAAAGGGKGSSSTIDEIKARKAYAFLDEYRESEMRQLREAIGKTRDAAQRERLQRALASMEDRKRAQERRDRERALLEEHRRREKELVRQGKKPFYLKRSERKKRLLVEQFQGMGKRQVDRAIERRRKKVAAREKKLLPLARRGPEDR